MEKILQGKVASGKGIVEGIAKIVKNPSETLEKDQILVTEITSPQFFSQMIKSKAIITDFGGLLCHTAILSRELGKPCVVGTEEATKIIRDGDKIKINLDNGEIFRIR